MKTFMKNGTEYELYQAAAGNWCVTINPLLGERETYNCGSKEDALSFILSEMSDGIWEDENENY